MEPSLPVGDLAWTGERLVTTCHRPLVYEHLHRYAVAFGLAKGLRVLDIACGEGYGAHLLAHVASKVIGVDLDAGTIAHAKAKYGRDNLQFLQGSCTEIPCADHSIDLVASFETIEHISEHDAFLSEIKRVLVPGGILVISSPHKAEYQKVSETANPFHAAELDHDEFVQLITGTFKYCVAAKQRLVIGSWIAPDEPLAGVSTATFRGWFDGIDIESGVYRGLYSIAVCSERALPVFNLGMFENFRDSADTWNLLDTYDTPAQLSARLSELTKAGEEKSQQVAQLQRDLEETSQQAAQFKADAGEKSGLVSKLQRECDQHLQLLEQLKHQTETSRDQLSRARDELLDARWEALTLRGTLLREINSADTPASRALELENRVETTTSERDQLRTMLASLQSDLEEGRTSGQASQNELQMTQAQLRATQGQLQAAQDQLNAAQDQLNTTQTQLKATLKELRSAEKQMDRLREKVSHKLILPFGKSQRKLQELTASRRTDD